MSETKVKAKKQRAFELDFLRGFSIFLMMLMHFAWNIRYIFAFDTFGFLESNYFWTFVEPFFLCIFAGVSGICCTFSRNNFIRGFKLLGVSLVFSIATAILTYKFDFDCLIVFNVLHMLAISIIIYAIVSLIEDKCKIDPKVTNVLMGLSGVWIATIGCQIYRLQKIIDGPWLLPFGIIGRNDFNMADYMPLIPWLGVFLIGVVVGRFCYAERKSLVKNPPKALLMVSKPFEFIGRHSLIIYVLHQPIILAITYLVVGLIRK